jgi:hypothetical protein
MVRVTQHANKRIKQRTSISKKAVNTVVLRALQDGIKHSDCSGRLKRYFDFLYFSYKSANNIRVYDGHVYIFQKDILITVFPLPYSFRKVATKIVRDRRDLEYESENSTREME